MATSSRRLSITWHGHATFVITTPGGKRIVTDPWLEGNPLCPPDMKRITEADVILLSHGHSDHTGDIVAVSRATGAPIVAVYFPDDTPLFGDMRLAEPIERPMVPRSCRGHRRLVDSRIAVTGISAVVQRWPSMSEDDRPRPLAAGLPSGLHP